MTDDEHIRWLREQHERIAAVAAAPAVMRPPSMPRRLAAFLSMRWAAKRGWNV